MALDQFALLELLEGPLIDRHRLCRLGKAS
jgi:hypothetical protein